MDWKGHELAQSRAPRVPAPNYTTAPASESIEDDVEELSIRVAPAPRQDNNFQTHPKSQLGVDLAKVYALDDVSTSSSKNVSELRSPKKTVDTQAQSAKLRHKSRLTYTHTPQWIPVIQEDDSLNNQQKSVLWIPSVPGLPVQGRSYHGGTLPVPAIMRDTYELGSRPYVLNIERGYIYQVRS